MTILLALTVLLWPSAALAAGDDGAALSGGPLAAVIAAGIAALAGFAGTVVQTRAARAARSALAAGDRATDVGARQVALDAAVLHARAKTARAQGAEAALALVTALEAEASRAECASCAVLRTELANMRAELARERDESRTELRSNLERVLPALADATTGGHEQAEAMAALTAQLAAFVAELRVRP